MVLFIVLERIRFFFNVQLGEERSVSKSKDTHESDTKKTAVCNSLCWENRKVPWAQDSITEGCNSFQSSKNTWKERANWEYHCKVFSLVNNLIVSVLHSAVKLTEANFNCGKITAQAGSGSIIHKILFYRQNKKKERQNLQNPGITHQGYQKSLGPGNMWQVFISWKETPKGCFMRLWESES